MLEQPIRDKLALWHKSMCESRIRRVLQDVLHVGTPNTASHEALMQKHPFLEDLLEERACLALRLFLINSKIACGWDVEPKGFSGPPTPSLVGNMLSSMIPSLATRAAQDRLQDRGVHAAYSRDHGSTREIWDLINGTSVGQLSPLDPSSNLPAPYESALSNLRYWSFYFIHAGEDPSAFFDTTFTTGPCPSETIASLLEFRAVHRPMLDFLRHVKNYNKTLKAFAKSSTGHVIKSKKRLQSMAYDAACIVQMVFLNVIDRVKATLPLLSDIEKEFEALRSYQFPLRSVEEVLAVFQPRHDSANHPCAPEDLVLAIPLGEFLLKGRSDEELKTGPFWLMWPADGRPRVVNQGVPLHSTDGDVGDPQYLGGWISASNMHPHVSHEGDICFGDHAATAIMLHKKHSLVGYVHMCMVALASYVPDSAYWRFDGSHPDEDDFGEDGVTCDHCESYGHIDDFCTFPNDRLGCSYCFRRLCVYDSLSDSDMWRDEAGMIEFGPLEGSFTDLNSDAYAEYVAEHGPNPNDQEETNDHAQGTTQEEPTQPTGFQESNPVQPIARLTGFADPAPRGPATTQVVGPAPQEAVHADAPVHGEVVGQAPLPA